MIRSYSVPDSCFSRFIFPISFPPYYQSFRSRFVGFHLASSYSHISHTILPDYIDFPLVMECSWICCLGDRLKNPQQTAKLSKNNVEVQPVGRGVDVLDANMARARVSPEHLVVMVNGLLGSSTDWKFAAEQFVKRLPDKVVVHRSECNCATLTFDGVDVMGERLAEEVLSVVERRPGLQKVSFVAHSLGGLVARYAIGKLYQPPEQLKPESDERDGLSESHLGKPRVARIARLEPMNFITFASPHLGSVGHRQLPFLCGLLFLEKQASQTAHLIAGRSGKHLFLTDNDDAKPPLLLRMSSDSYDFKFISALRSFKRRVAYANANYDHVVGWRTSSIRRPHELPKDNLREKNDVYPHIVCVEPETFEADHCKASLGAQDQKIDLEEEMVRGLRQVPWERVDVSFHGSRQRYVAHNTIQVKSYWLNSDGVPIISHMIDNFIV